VAREQSPKRFNAIKGFRNLRKDNQRTERELTNQSVAIGKDRVRKERQVMFGKKKRTDDEALIKKANKKLDRAADRAVKEAKNTQEVILANGFTLELLLAMGGKAKND
jgi:RecA/RadA recombinase